MPSKQKEKLGTVVNGRLTLKQLAGCVLAYQRANGVYPNSLFEAVRLMINAGVEAYFEPHELTNDVVEDTLTKFTLRSQTKLKILPDRIRDSMAGGEAIYDRIKIQDPDLGRIFEACYSMASVKDLAAIWKDAWQRTYNQDPPQPLDDWLTIYGV